MAAKRHTRLGALAALGIAVWLISLTAVACFIWYVDVKSSAMGRQGVLLASLRLAGVFLTGFGIVCYIRVSRAAPRPLQLHWHGRLFVAMLPELVAAMHAESVGRAGVDDEQSIRRWVFSGLVYALWGVRRSVFFALITKRLKVLGSARSCWLSIRVWGRLLIANALLLGLGSITINSWWMALMVGWGVPLEDIVTTQTARPSEWNVPMVHKVVLASSLYMGVVSYLGTLISTFVFLSIACFLVRAALKNLRKREVDGERLATVRSTLRQQLSGLLATVLSNMLLLVTVMLDVTNSFGEDQENLMITSAHFLDVTGDVAGILLLSGMGALLFNEDSEAGDVSGYIGGLLQSAVLTTRATNVFEGHVAVTRTNRCVVSFPGKFLAEWHSLTWLCEQGQLSSACVFLPSSDPQERFGAHAPQPGNPQGECWCVSLYGKQEPWGCMWFDAWLANIQRAKELNLDLVVVFFPGQTGMGKVSWEELGTSDLWDGVGLGGSQKAEVAYLQEHGYGFLEEDVTSFTHRAKIKSLAPDVQSGGEARRGAQSAGASDRGAQPEFEGLEDLCVRA